MWEEKADQLRSLRALKPQSTGILSVMFSMVVFHFSYHTFFSFLRIENSLKLTSVFRWSLFLSENLSFIFHFLLFVFLSDNLLFLFLHFLLFVCICVVFTFGLFRRSALSDTIMILLQFDNYCCAHYDEAKKTYHCYAYFHI